jgi:hypothetical protein
LEIVLPLINTVFPNFIGKNGAYARKYSVP